MKKFGLLVSLLAIMMVSCDNEVPFNPYVEHKGGPHVKKYPGDLAVKWNRMQMAVGRSTPGFNPGLATRAFAYSGLTLYESVVESIPGHQSVASFMIGQNITSHPDFPFIYGPASGNAAMAEAVRNFIPTASVANKARIDSLEQTFNNQFAQEVPAQHLENSIAYGKQIAQTIFDWSKSDGFAEAAAKNSSYIIPTGPGLWQKTPPAFAFPVNAYANEIRTFVKNSTSKTLAPPPIPYSEIVGSDFYNQVNFVYNYSQSLTPYEITTVKTWGEFPGNYTNALRYIMIAIQVIDESDLSLDIAAVAFAKHNMALQEAVNCVFTSKYTYNVMRPITYIRSVMGHTTWNTINVTPPHPEYPAAHSCVGRASSRILETILGKHYSFTDRTHEALYGARSYNSLKEYSDEAGWSRVLGGIHYYPTIVVGSNQGEKVANLINGLPFQKQYGYR
jgi:PAP2 superfamily